MGSPEAGPRRVPRKHPRGRLVTQVESRASGASSLGRTEDISGGGLLVVSSDTFDPKTEVLVRFNLPTGHHIDCPGVVAHTVPGVRMGIQFTGQLKDDDLRAIEGFVQQACE